MNVHIPRPGGREEELELPTGQETLTALRTGEGVGEGVGRGRRGSGEGEERECGEWEGMGRRGGSGNFYKQIN